MKRMTVVVISVLGLLSLRYHVQAQDHSQHHQDQEKEIQNPQDEPKEVYFCHMHPEVVSDKPGKSLGTSYWMATVGPLEANNKVEYSVIASSRGGTPPAQMFAFMVEDW